ncbi:rhodanese-like domain-containing protein 11, chloroplastic isoform X2 [Ricinus communis]|uniref:rhodanese-like domain-containing protein 11, chloroplastic isoform X2 n=1 Tax=Ricinus communis TaxID=3988 RepID=UPI00077298F2|nr:rhodanese-like domain-containing protein 11, chloroplastic isoform X2 [Ricinus communis]|eukprot:XP_015581911.1 rhodanese-like domain-containing protein 11, chloroplastic isoform X2 [Ricinus communis]
MEASGLSSLNALTPVSYSKFQRGQSSKFYGKFISSMPASLYFTRTLTSHRFQPVRVLQMQAGDDEDYDLKQMRDMAAAKRRWDLLIREGKVKVLTPREAGYAIQLSNKTLLDVRPSVERKKAWVKGSSWIPIFEVDNRSDIGTLSSKITTFMMGGWWSGAPTLAYDNQFLLKVEEKFPKDTDLIVACQRGLRSLAACELLYNAGYRNLFWVQGGLEAAEEEDLVTEGPQPLKFAGIGGVSEFLGWTDQQRVAAAKEGWGYRLLFSARLVGVILVADALFLGAQQVSRYFQDIRSH